MVQEDYVSFELAKLLKEKGFPQTLDKVEFKNLYREDGTLIDTIQWFDECYDPDDYYVAPYISLVQKWLIENKKIEVFVKPYGYYERNNIKIVKHGFTILDYRDEFKFYPFTIDEEVIWDYNEALEAGINKALELI